MSDTSDRPDIRSTRGTIWAIFGHRLAIEGPDGRILVDLGPEGAKGLILEPGDTITVTGERRPSEIKVASITLPDGTRHTVPRKTPPHSGKLAKIKLAKIKLAKIKPGKIKPTEINPSKIKEDMPDHAPADPAAALAALAALERAGYRVAGPVTRRPKHLEVSAMKDDGAFTMHLDLDGTIRGAKPDAASLPQGS